MEEKIDDILSDYEKSSIEKNSDEALDTFIPTAYQGDNSKVIVNNGEGDIINIENCDPTQYKEIIDAQNVTIKLLKEEIKELKKNKD